MPDYIRWGILGASNFARNHMAPALHAAPQGTLEAIATRTIAKAEPFREMVPQLRVHNSYDALLADPNIDAVYIPLPHTLHVEWSLKALAAGKHVLSEKPIAMRASDIDQVIAARDATGLLATEAYMIVHHPQWDKVRELITTGAIGKLGHISAQFTYNNAADQTNIRNASETGGGSLPDIGVYTIGAMRWITQAEPTVTHANLTYEDGVEVTTRASLQFGDISADFLTSMRLDRHQQMTIFGSEGRIHLNAPFNPRDFAAANVTLFQGKGPAQVFSYPKDAQYELQVTAFNKSALSGAPYPWTLEQAKGTQTVIDALYAQA